jgi:hypothetical protein
MRKSITIFGVLLLLSLLVVPAVPSMAQTILTYDSCIQVQNLSSTEALVMLRFFEQGNTVPVAEPADSIPADGSKTFCPLGAVSAGFNGSVVIESDQPVVAIANVTGGSWNAHNASYTGFSGGAQTVNLPLLHYNNWGWYSWFNVQNVGGATADVDVYYSDGTQSLDNVLEPNLAITFNQADETHGLAVFAARVESDQPIVVTVMEVGPRMLLGYNGFASAHPNPVMPLVITNNWGYTIGIQIMNTDATARNVTVTYTPSLAGTACAETKSIPGGESVTFGLNAWDAGDADADNNCVNGETFIGSGRVTDAGTQPLVAIVNQHHFGRNKGASYGAFNPDLATSKVVMPLITDHNYGYFTGFNVQNVGASAATVTCTFYNSARTVGPLVLLPGEALTDTQYGVLGDPYVGSATCSAAEGDAKIIGVVNYLRSSGTADTFLVYEAFSAP